MRFNNKKWIVTMMVASVVIALALIGGNWKVGLAGQTTPTLPQASSYTPKTVKAGSNGFTLTVTGTNLISTEWTKVRWSKDGETPVDLTPDSVVQNGSTYTLTLSVPAERITDGGVISAQLVNHPSAQDEREVGSVMKILVAQQYIFLPIVSK